MSCNPPPPRIYQPYRVSSPAPPPKRYSDQFGVRRIELPMPPRTIQSPILAIGWAIALPTAFLLIGIAKMEALEKQQAAAQTQPAYPEIEVRR